jgi:hypothetical protein
MPKASNLAGDNESVRRWGLLRVGLGTAQIFMAALGIVLLVKSGVNRWSVLAATLAFVLTMVSVWVKKT